MTIPVIPGWKLRLTEGDMSEDTPVDAIGPWTIKAVSTATRDKVTIAARKEGLTVGQWLERRVNEWLADGEPVRVIPSQPTNGGKLAPVSPQVGHQADHDELRELVHLAVELSPNDPESSLLRLARSTVRDRLRSLRRT